MKEFLCILLTIAIVVVSVVLGVLVLCQIFPP